MSLLDRVQQRREGEPATFGTRPASTAPSPAAPAAPAAPAPEKPAASTAVADGGGQNRPGSPLLNRTGGLTHRGSLGKSNALQERYDTLRQRVHQRLVEEMVTVDDASQDTVVAKIGELVSEVAAEMALTISRQDK